MPIDDSFGGRGEELPRRLEERVNERTHGRVRGVRVEVIDGGIVVHGRTESHHVKQLALKAVSELSHSQDVKLNIEISTHAARMLRSHDGEGSGNY